MLKILTKELLYKLYFVEKKTIKQISEELQVSRQAIKNRFKKYNFKSRQCSLDITNQKFSKLTPIRILCKSNNGNIWECKCDCGNIKNVLLRNLKLKKVTQCTNCATKAKFHKCYKGLSGTLWSQIQRSKFRGLNKNKILEFDITPKYIWDLFEQQNKRCALSGIHISLPESRKSGTASLDRIDSSKGYIKGNVQWVHKTINKMKNNLSEKEFLDWCNKISKYRINI